MSHKQQSYTGPTWRNVDIALHLMRERFGGFFIAQICSAQDLGTGTDRGLHVSVIWRGWYNFRVWDMAMVHAIYNAQDHGSVPALICELVIDLQTRLIERGQERQPLVSLAEHQQPQED